MLPAAGNEELAYVQYCTLAPKILASFVAHSSLLTTLLLPSFLPFRGAAVACLLLTFAVVVAADEQKHASRQARKSSGEDPRFLKKIECIS